MRLSVLLNYINVCQRGCMNLRIVLSFVGNTSGVKYELTIHRGKIKLIKTLGVISIEGDFNNSLELDFDDDVFTINRYRETSFCQDGTYYEDKTINVKYLAQIYIHLFRNLGDRINLICRHENKYFDCYYVDGKLLYAVEEDGVYCLYGTNLYALNGDYPGYEIIMFSEANFRPSYADFLSSSSATAKELGLKFKKSFNNTDCVVNL